MRLGSNRKCFECWVEWRYVSTRQFTIISMYCGWKLYLFPCSLEWFLGKIIIIKKKIVIYLTLGIDASLQFIHLCTDSVSALVFLKPPSLKPLSLICLQLACACVHHLFHLLAWRLFKKKKKTFLTEKWQRTAQSVHWIQSGIWTLWTSTGKKIPQFDKNYMITCERMNPIAASIDCCSKSKFDMLFWFFLISLQNICNLQRKAKLPESDGAGVHATLRLIPLAVPKNDHIRKSPLADTSQTQ